MLSIPAPRAVASVGQAAVPSAAVAYYPMFDWLRIALAMVVVFHHENLFAWKHAGNLAVQVFFALSGWLIGGILLETEPRGLARFWFNRATRIWIPYAIAVTLLLGLALVRDPTWRDPAWIRTAVAYLTMTYNWFGYAAVEAGDPIIQAMPLKGTGHPFWSIGVEEQFYLFAPLLLVLAPRRLGRSPLVWVLISVAAVTLNLFGAISLGVLGAVLKHRFGAWHETQAASRAFAVTALLSAAAMIAGARYELAAPIFAIAVVLPLARAGEKSVTAAFFGGISYPLYLNGWIGIFAANALKRIGLHQPAVALVIAPLLAVGVASALYLLVDRQVMNRRSAWFTPRLGWALGIAGFAMISAGVAFQGG